MTLHPKAIGGTGGASIGGAIAGLFLWLLSFYGVNVPAEQAANITTIVCAACALAGAYLTPSPEAPKP